MSECELLKTKSMEGVFNSIIDCVERKLPGCDIALGYHSASNLFEWWRSIQIGVCRRTGLGAFLERWGIIPIEVDVIAYVSESREGELQVRQVGGNLIHSKSLKELARTLGRSLGMSVAFKGL